MFWLGATSREVSLQLFLIKQKLSLYLWLKNMSSLLHEYYVLRDFINNLKKHRQSL